MHLSLSSIAAVPEGDLPARVSADDSEVPAMSAFELNNGTNTRFALVYLVTQRAQTSVSWPLCERAAVKRCRACPDLRL